MTSFPERISSSLVERGNCQGPLPLFCFCESLSYSLYAPGPPGQASSLFFRFFPRYFADEYGELASEFRDQDDFSVDLFATVGDYSHRIRDVICTRRVTIVVDHQNSKKIKANAI